MRPSFTTARMTRDTPTASPATESDMDGFRRLMTVVLITGIVAGAVLAALQLIAIRPMIQVAEVYETQLRDAGKLRPEDSMEWQPSQGFERIGYTIASTVLLG